MKNMTAPPTQPTLNIAGYDIYPLSTGRFGLDGGAMFGTVPKVLWEKQIPADASNRIEMEARALLLVGNNKKILIDTGNGADFIKKYGPKLGAKFAEMYNIQNGQEMGLLTALRLHGIEASQITDVILTHLHFDHAGGATTEVDDKLVPTFKNATYYIQKQNMETAAAPNIRERASYYSANFAPLQEANCLRQLDGPVENLLPGISVEVSHGHTQGMQIVRIADEKNTLVYCADLIPTRAHVRSAWIMGYDLHPLILIKEKQQLLKRVASQNWTLFFEHDPYHAMAQVEEDHGDFKAIPQA